VAIPRNCERQSEGYLIAMQDQPLFNRAGYDITVTDIHKAYRTGADEYRALQGISCAFARGHVTIIQGPSGCGKSTLLNMVGGVDHPDRGSVQVGGRDLGKTVADKEMAEYRLLQVGFVFQAYNLISGLSALENLQLPMAVAGLKRPEQTARAKQLLGLVGMAAKCEKKPDALSGGEQQRVAIALTLVNDPPVILADEPTGNLDTANAKRVVDLLCSLAHEHGKTVIITTHDPVVSQRGDQVLHMRDGQFERA